MKEKKSYYVSSETAVKAKSCGDTMLGIINENMGAVHYLVKQMHFNQRIYREDMVYEGRAAIIAAVNKFDPEKSNNFNSYMYLYIKGYLLNFTGNKYFKHTDSANVKIYGQDSRTTKIETFESASNTAADELREDIMYAVKNTLNEKETEIFLRHSGIIHSKHTFKKIGEDLGMSKMGVCKCYKKAQRKLAEQIQK